MQGELAAQRRAPAPPVPEAIGRQAIAAPSPALGVLETGLNRAPNVQRLAVMRSGLTKPQRSANVAQLHTAPVVQRAMQVDGPDDLPAAMAAKMNVVVATLRRMGAQVGGNVQLNLYVDGNPERLETNPADTTLTTPGNSGLRRIDIRIRRWFIEISSVGEILGMIDHELGVHSLADIEMGAAGHAIEDAEVQIREPHIAAIAGANRSRRSIIAGAADRRQADHVNVAKFAVAPDDAGHVPGAPMPRMQQYINTMLRLGAQIAAAPAGEYADAPARQRALNEMFQTFLFDMGRLIATDDGRAWAIATGTGDIAAVFNWLRTHVIQPYAGTYPWLDTVTIAPATRMSLIGMLSSVLARTLWAQRGAIARQAGRGLRALPGQILGAAVGGVQAGVGWVGGLFARRAAD